MFESSTWNLKPAFLTAWSCFDSVTSASTEPTRTECVTSTPSASSLARSSRVTVMRSICGAMSAFGATASVKVIRSGSVAPAPPRRQAWIVKRWPAVAQLWTTSRESKALPPCTARFQLRAS
jgi:hypothetical protein